MATKESATQIVDEIFNLKVPEINEERRPAIHAFCESTINGDEPKNHLVISAALSKNSKGVLAYVLTNVRLIKIEISEKETQSSSFFLEKMTGMERKLIEGNRIEVSVSFNNDSFGLRYNPSESKTTEFFQKVEQSRAKGTL